MSDERFPSGGAPLSESENGSQFFVMDGIRIYGGRSENQEPPIISEKDRARYDQLISELEKLVGERRTKVMLLGDEEVLACRDSNGKEYRIRFNLARDIPSYRVEEGEPSLLQPTIDRIWAVANNSSGEREEWLLGENRPEGTYWLEFRRDKFMQPPAQSLEFRVFALDRGEDVAYEPDGQNSPDTLSRFEQLLEVIKIGQRSI